MAFAGALSAARAADVEITADTPAVNLDAETGSTAHIASGVTVGPGNPAISATLQAWSVANDGIVTGGNTVKLDQGGTFTNASGASVTGSLTALTFGYKPFALPPAGGPGTLNNYGTITGGVEGVTMWFGGTVNNYLGGTIKTETGLNAVSIGQGTSRTLFNSGRIEATKTTGFSTGVLIQGGPATFTNTSTGVIFGDYNGVYASVTGVFTSFDNAGSIRSTRGPAVEATGGGAITNSGTIQSTSSDGLYLGRAGTVTNSGTITGATRAINFASNYARTLNLDTGSVLNGLVQGGSGVDELVLLGTGAESAAKFLAFEKLKMQGTDWEMTGAGTFTTSASVEAGLLSVNGTLTSPTVTVDPLARLGGGGTIVGAVTNKGTIAAGNSIGTLSVQGSLAFDAGSTLETEVNAAGQTDLVDVTGTVAINGGTVSVLAASGSYAPSTQYTIVSTTGGRSGIFSGVTSNFAFLAPTLTYDANNVYLTLDNNGIDFDAIGGTPNQRATGTGVQGLESGNPIYDAVLVLDIPEARYAFDQLSGEIHASVAGLLLDDSRHVREAALGRLREGSGSGERSVWAQAYGAQTDLDGDGNAADFDYDSAGIFAGLDGELGDAWQAGALVGYSRATFDVDARNSSGSADSFHLAAYGGGQWGEFSLRGGVAYAWQSIDTARAIAFQGFSDSTEADYDGHTAQLFGEASYALQAGAATFEPTAALAYVDVGTDDFTEDGGDAALTSDGTSADATFSTLGVRARAPFDIGSFKAQASSFLGWRHAFGDTVPRIDLAFAGENPFGIAGTPIARDAAIVELGLDVGTGAASRFALAYSGQFGDGATSQAFKAAFSLAF
ncbi:autotransporter domain-containing protein [Mesorhizobium sp. KR9-304]|uniref:autotransporter outer membrane beta-barrel domain-containing protein n=1 Tax=Mesorhizobium sp. KR9-304 TaxID=3156614 RepID=UPI0032B5322C